MKKHLQLSVILLALGAFLFAQEKTEVTVKVTKDGKVVKDTTYTFDDDAEAKHVVHMMDAMASDELNIFFSDSDEHKMHMKKDGDHKMHANKVMFISEDGTRVEKVEGEHTNWVTTTVSEDGKTETITIKKMKGDSHGKSHVYVTSGDGEDIEKNVQVIVKELEDGKGGKKTIKKEYI